MPMGASSSPVTFATTKLSYPIFDCEFDPYDRGYLLVGGGGGENRTGVPNKLTLLDTSAHDAVSQVAEVDLSVEEDSPQTIASLTTRQGLITLAGISSSAADQKAGKNEHLRSFDVEFPPKKRAKKDDTAQDPNAQEKRARIELIRKSQLFKPAPSDFRNPRTYQRLLRLSPVKGRDVASKRIGAVAPADAAENEILLFDATTFNPTSSSVLQRLALDQEPEDLDLHEPSEGQFTLAYCTNYDVFVYSLHCDFSTKTSKALTAEPLKLYSVPQRDAGPRAKIRCLRWLSDEHIALLQNTQPGGAPELIILSIDAHHGKPNVSVAQRKKLPKSLPMGIRLATCLLDADPATGERQIILAVAGQNKTIHVYTTNHEPSNSDPSLRITPLQPFTILDTSAQHPQSISKIAFSNFFPPRQPDTTMSVASSPSYIQLASVSVGWTVSVETFALTSTPTHPADTADDPIAAKSANATNRPSVRWILSSRHSELLRTWSGLFVAAIAFLVLAILTQSYLSRNASRGDPSRTAISDLFAKLNNVAGGASWSISPAATGASSVLDDVTATVESAAISASARTEHTLHSLRDLLHLHRHHLQVDSEDPYAQPAKAILLQAPENPFSKDPVSAVPTLDEEKVEELKRKGAKRFEDLSHEQKVRWERRLREAGQWSEEEGFKVLKGVLFSEYARVVGGAIRDAVLQ